METAFLTHLLTLPGISPETLLTSFLLIFFRLVPLVILCPFMGAKVAPAIARVGIALFLAILFLPTTLVSTANAPPTITNFIPLALKEVLIGFFLAFISNVPFFIVQSTGIIIDYMRGSSMMMQQDPSFQQQASPIGILYNYLLIVLFYHLDGAILFFNLIDSSLFSFPPTQGFPLFLESNKAAWNFSTAILQNIFAMGIQFGAPSILAILMAEVFLGIANRMAPQVQIAFLGMSLKSLAGLFLLFMSFVFVTRVLGDFMISYFIKLNHLF